MVKGVGWWKTFGTIIVLGAAFFVVSLVISLIGRASSTLSSILLLLFEIAAGPFAICYVSTMYLGSAGEALPAAAGYAVPAPPAYAAPYVSPPTPGDAYQPAAAPPIAPPVSAGAATIGTAVVGGPSPEVDADAWKAAADPLAAQPPAQPPAADEHASTETLAVDAASGQLEKHCSQCGALIAGSDDFCQACALEVSGGEAAGDGSPAADPGAAAPTAPVAPDAPDAPQA